MWESLGTVSSFDVDEMQHENVGDLPQSSEGPRPRMRARGYPPYAKHRNGQKQAV